MNGTGKAVGANAIRSIAGRLRNVTTIVVGPIPKRFEIRVVVNAAISDPILPTENNTPITPGDRPTSRTRKTRKIENVTLKNRFDVAVHPA